METLKAFKLTYLEAKTYIALTELGESTIETIAKYTKTARQNLYTPLSELEKMSLVQKYYITLQNINPWPWEKPPKYLYKCETKKVINFKQK